MTQNHYVISVLPLPKRDRRKLGRTLCHHHEENHEYFTREGELTTVVERKNHDDPANKNDDDFIYPNLYRLFVDCGPIVGMRVR